MANMKEIAKLAGVSIITVSRALNTPEKVKESTRLKVEKIMKELEFQPNQAAKALVSNKTRTIHVMIPEAYESSDPFVMRLLAGISDELSKNYYSLLIRREWESPYKCDGVIVMGLDKGEDKYLSRIKEPHVLFGQTDMEVNWVDVNNHSGSYFMTQYIIDQGHEKIGFIAVDENKKFAVDRLLGYQEALKNNHLSVSASFIQYAANEERYGYEKALYLLENTEVTALFCSTDILALGALRAARETGLKVPNELSIAGFDGTAYDQLADPPLTTMRQPVYRVGKQLAEMIIKKIEASTPAAIDNVLIEPDIIIRKSSGRRA